MQDHSKRLESILFNLESTNRTDFRNGDIKPLVFTKYQTKPHCIRIRPRPLKNIHALTEWRVPNVPYNLFGTPKDVVRTNPYDVQKPYGKLADVDLKTVQETRPRLVMTPAGCLDDLADRPRKVLTDDMYVTSAVYNTRGVFAASNNVVAPFPGLPAAANPITIPKLSPPHVSPEWRMDSVSWDNRQLRSYADPTKEFWLARVPNCEACKETAAREAMKKLKLIR